MHVKVRSVTMFDQAPVKNARTLMLSNMRLGMHAEMHLVKVINSSRSAPFEILQKTAKRIGF